ncbi:MAG TPA: DUF58 domain-containing protein, partial [Candidatus Caenarcaniphilales bacterium]
GIGFALLAVAAVLPARSLFGIEVTRQPIMPVSVGDTLLVELAVENRTTQPKMLLQVQDLLPERLGQPVRDVVETIPARSHYRWTYQQVAQRRGIYRWQIVQLRTATPFGLFWCRRDRPAPATAVVYPGVLPLTYCPLIDQMGQELRPQFQSSSYRASATTEGLTRSLRPYRWGDPARLVHWRSSARAGELRVRELEAITGGQEILISLDSALSWHPDHFEQAVVAAASLYFYARRHKQTVELWTAGAGLLRGHLTVLEALAQVDAGEAIYHKPSQRPSIWLTGNSATLNHLPAGSRWILWPTAPQPGMRENLLNLTHPGIVIQADQPLQLQLQSTLS